MDMYELDTQVDNELFEERVNFVKSILKEKCLEMEALNKNIDALTERLEVAEEEYEKLLTMTVDDVYDKYVQTKYSSKDAKVILEFDYNKAIQPQVYKYYNPSPIDVGNRLHNLFYQYIATSNTGNF